MRTVTSEWFEVKVSYKKTADNGVERKVNETYAVDALSFTEAERRATQQMQLLTDEFYIQDIKRAAYREVAFIDDETVERFYKAKVQFLSPDEKTGKVKRSTAYYLVNARSIEGARKTVEDMLRDSLEDYEIASLVETQILEAWGYSDNPTTEKPKTEEKKQLCSAVGAFIDSIPKGQKVTISTQTEKGEPMMEPITIDKTGDTDTSNTNGTDAG